MKESGKWGEKAHCDRHYEGGNEESHESVEGEHFVSSGDSVRFARGDEVQAKF